LTGGTTEGNPYFIHCGIEFLKILVQSKSLNISGENLVLPARSWKQITLWKQALRLPQNALLRRMSIDTPEALKSKDSQIFLWDSIASVDYIPGSTAASARAYGKQRVPLETTKGLRGLIILADGSVFGGGVQTMVSDHSFENPSNVFDALKFYTWMKKNNRVYGMVGTGLKASPHCRI
jgi:hypothetical protein